MALQSSATFLRSFRSSLLFPVGIDRLFGLDQVRQPAVHGSDVIVVRFDRLNDRLDCSVQFGSSIVDVGDGVSFLMLVTMEIIPIRPFVLFGRSPCLPGDRDFHDVMVAAEIEACVSPRDFQ